METPRFYISVYLPIAGWKAIKYGRFDPELGHLPWETSPVAFKTKASAIEWAKCWAKDEGLEFIDDDPDFDEDAPDKSVTEQLQEIFPDIEVINL